MHPKNFESNRIQKSALETGVCNFKWDFDKIYSHMLMASKCKNHFKIKLHCKLFQFHLEYILRKLFHSKSHTHTHYSNVFGARRWCPSVIKCILTVHFNRYALWICGEPWQKPVKHFDHSIWRTHEHINIAE